MESCIESGIIHPFPKEYSRVRAGIPASREILGKLGSREVEPCKEVVCRGAHSNIAGSVVARCFGPDFGWY